VSFWAVIFIITLVIGVVSFFSGEYGIWLGALIFWIISIIVMMADSDNSKRPPIQSSFVSESDLQNNFLEISWREMEELAGELFRRKGYSVKVTQASNDYGIDVWAKKDGMVIGIQVKKWHNDVGFDDVAKTLGSNMSKANKYILISTTSFFTLQAWKHQRQHSTIIELWDTDRFKKELRENFARLPDSNKPAGFVQDKTDSCDYDKEFNLDEVCDSSEDS